MGQTGAMNKILREKIDEVVSAAGHLRDRFDHHLPPHQQVQDAHTKLQSAVRDLKSAAHEEDAAKSGS
jgi:hypothetical protein